MFAVNRASQQALRRIARPSLVQQLAAPVNVAAQQQQRFVATEKITPSDSYSLLVEQRRQRPVSPHLGIYRPQITWYGSALNRITGGVLSGTFYVFGASYLLAPLVGLNFGSASMAAAFGGLPVAVKFATKALLAFPFTFHSFNGLRHLTWDLGKSFQNKTIIRTGWTVFALSGLSTIYLAGFV